MSNYRPGFPQNIACGDLLLIRGRVVLTNIYREPDPALLIDFGDGHEVEIPLAAAFGIITRINGEKP